MTAASRRAPGTIAGLAGCAAVLGATALILAISAAADEGIGPPDVARPVALTFLLGLPAAVGLVGVWRAQPALLIAAGALCLLQSFVAFSGVTLLYLAPALLFLRAGSELDPPDAAPPPQWRPARVAVAVLVSIPIAWVLIRTLGIAGIVVLVLVAGLGRGLSLRPETRPRLQARSGALALAVVGLVVAAWIGVFASTETRCWIARQTPSGIEYESHPAPSGPSQSVTIERDEVAAGCDGGSVTVQGGLIAFALGAAAVTGAAFVPVRGRGRERTANGG